MLESCRHDREGRVSQEGRHLAQRAFRQTGKTALRSTLTRGRGGPGYSGIL
jgi:hypothetical protein